MTTEKFKRLRVTRDEKSPTQYSVFIAGEVSRPATLTEVNIWKMYLQALDLACRLRKELESVAALETKSAAELKANRRIKTK